MKKVLLVLGLFIALQACSSGGGSNNKAGSANTPPAVNNPTDKPSVNPTPNDPADDNPTDVPDPGWKEGVVTPGTSQNNPQPADVSASLVAANASVLVIYDSKSKLYESADWGNTWELTHSLSAQPDNLALDIGRVRVRTVEGKIYADVLKDSNFLVYRRVAKNNWVLDDAAKPIFQHYAQSSYELEDTGLKGPFYYPDSVSGYPMRALNPALTSDVRELTTNLENLSYPYYPMNLARGKVYLLGRFKRQNKVGIIAGTDSQYPFKSDPFPEVLDQQGLAMASSVRYDVVVTSPTGKLSSPSFYRAPYGLTLVRDATHWTSIDALKKYTTPAYSFVDLKYLAKLFVTLLNHTDGGKSSCIILSSKAADTFGEKVLADTACRSVYYVNGKYVIAATKTAGPNAGKLFFITAAAL